MKKRHSKHFNKKQSHKRGNPIPNAESPNDTLTHKRLIYDYMLTGKGVTGLEAVKMFGCMSLSQRCGDLIRNDGVPIIKTWEQNPTTGKRYKRYSLPISYIQSQEATA